MALSAPITIKQVVAQLYDAEHKTCSDSNCVSSSVGILTPQGTKFYMGPLEFMQRLTPPAACTVFFELPQGHLLSEGVYYYVDTDSLCQEFDLKLAQTVVIGDKEYTEYSYSKTGHKVTRYYPAWPVLHKILYNVAHEEHIYTRPEAVKLLHKLREQLDAVEYLRQFLTRQCYSSNTEKLVEYTELLGVVHNMVQQTPKVAATVVILGEYIKVIDKTIYPTSYKNTLLATMFTRLCTLCTSLQTTAFVTSNMSLWDEVRALTVDTSNFESTYVELLNKFPAQGNTVLLLTAHKLQKRLSLHVTKLDPVVYERLLKLTTSLVKLMSQY